ncbi:cobalamin biosynthesis protein CobD [Formosimonas limnophila]|uniref:Cobalamin biosynthesis protein CobD n=1 Tax=Formosimonas limnophila TaxID=1384487 RepID=A0A8J3FZ92_9BURK|nr:regulatory signaling modulator protein AmpE [Formosimonas limnophila]GHA66601.1 cobalamin biosynthesis protein CobD [Formosimonas limnophila]
MSLIAILGALLLEQIFPLSSYTKLRLSLRNAIDFIERALASDDAKPWQIFWFITLVGALLAGLLGLIFTQINWLLGLAFTLILLYLTLGIRQFSHFFTKIRVAINAGQGDVARTELAAWLHEEAEITGYRGNVVPEKLSDTEVIRQSLELALLSSLRYVFGGLFWFLVFAIVGLGPAGVVFYRLSDLVSRRWILRADGKRDAYTRYARKMMSWIEFLPARCAAMIYAVVGNFEDAMHCWRTQAQKLRGLGETDAAAVILTSGAGALNITLRDGVMVKNDMPMDEHEQALYGETKPMTDVAKDDELTIAGQIGVGAVPDVRSLQSAIGVFWRSMLFVLGVLLLLTLSKALG